MTVWQRRLALIAECSGAKDLMVPGEYAEILKKHANEDSPVLKDVEKDVGRTFPGNVFFGESQRFCRSRGERCCMTKCKG